MRLVAEFHTKFDLNDTRATRVRLLAEEFEEYVAAEHSSNARAIAHELADIVYAAYGTALTYGIDLGAALRAIHEANMSRIAPDGSFSCDATGKVLKGPSYRPPDLGPATQQIRSDLGLCHAASGMAQR
jgi:predicted HAD superfamily Cof-like phosphohydrolase